MINLLETSLPNLVAQTNLTFPDTDARLNSPNDAKLSNVRFVPSGKNLVVKADATGLSNRYQVAMELVDVNPSGSNGTSPNVEFIHRGKKYTVDPISADQTDVKVACTCLDFRFRFAYYNNNDGSLYGNPPPPYVKSPGSIKGPANPKRTPGVCKHILALFQHLQHMGVIRG